MTNNNSNSFSYLAEDVSQIDKNKPSIYVACLAACNSGKLHGCWIDATQDVDTIYTQIIKMLAESPEPDAREWAIHDYQGFGSLEIYEYSDIKSVCEKAQFIEGYGALGAALLDYYDSDVEFAKTALNNSYHGEEWDSELEFATDLFNECYARDFSERNRFYIDYEKFSCDLFINDYFSLNIGGRLHIFSEQ